MKYKILSISLLLVVVTLASMSMASATSEALGAFNQTYSLSGTELDSCATCHGESALTPYGMDVLASGLDFASIEDSDSDGDGFTNIEEINAMTYPGDPEDYPEAMVEEMVPIEEVENEEIVSMEEESAIETTSEKKTPGFEMIFAIAGILSVAFIKRRK